MGQYIIDLSLVLSCDLILAGVYFGEFERYVECAPKWIFTSGTCKIVFFYNAYQQH